MARVGERKSGRDRRSTVAWNEQAWFENVGREGAEEWGDGVQPMGGGGRLVGGSSEDGVIGEISRGSSTATYAREWVCSSLQ